MVSFSTPEVPGRADPRGNAAATVEARKKERVALCGRPCLEKN